MHDARTSNANSKSGGNSAAALDVTTICTNGLIGFPGAPRRPVKRDQVAIVKEFLARCRRTSSVWPHCSPVSSTLKHQIEAHARRYISTGAVIVAAVEMNIVAVPCCHGARDCLIGVSARDVERLIKGTHP